MIPPFKYVISDMDGTLFGPDHHVSDYTRDTLKTLVHEHGVTLILATGRHYPDVKVVSDNLKKFIWGDDTAASATATAATAASSRPPMMYLLTSNGAVAHNAVTHELVFQTSVDPVLAEKLYHHLPADEEAVNTCVYQENEWICRIDWPWMLKIFKESGVTYQLAPDPPRHGSTSSESEKDAAGEHKGLNVGNYDNISKLYFLSYDTDRLHSLVADVAKIAKECGNVPYSWTYSSFMCLDIMAEGVCKGQAIRKLFQTILPPEEGKNVVAGALHESIAFGDGLNDAEMLTKVEKGCVMANAAPKLREQVPELEVVLSNAEDGVARKLRAVFGIDA